MRAMIFQNAKRIVGLCIYVGAAASAHAQVITPQRDMTQIDLADGPVTMLHTVTEMNNAHPLETISFFKPSTTGAAQQIPFEMNGDYDPILPIRTGADCAVSGVRTIKTGKQLRVVFALRKGQWAERKKVTFLIFNLEKNDEQAPGTPPLYFKQQKKVTTTSEYCDVNAALTKEEKLYRPGN